MLGFFGGRLAEVLSGFDRAILESGGSGFGGVHELAGSFAGGGAEVIGGLCDRWACGGGLGVVESGSGVGHGFVR